MKQQTSVRKRDGRLEPVNLTKITDRITALVGAEDNTRLDINPFELAQEVVARIKNGIDTKTLDNLAARKAHNRMFEHPDWDVLAARIAVSNYHKETYGFGHIFSEIMREFHRDGKISDKTWDVVQTYDQELDDAIDYDRDYDTTYLGFKRFEHTYAIRLNEKPVERRQDMFMRVAIGIHGDDLDDILETYEWMSCGYFTHATPTLFNAGTPKAQCSSCFLLAMKEEKDKYPYVDSIEKIYETLWDCAVISKAAGGIGLSISNVRPRDSVIRSVGRKGRGLTPMLKNFNETARYVDQGLRRKGAFAMYLEPWHADVFEFLELKEPMGQDENRARDLHYALWIPDLFMKRCAEDGIWSLMDPSVCPELINTHSDEFEMYYTKYEREGKFMRQVKANELMGAIITSMIQTGQPYILYKDHCNSKSNQKNLGTIRSSNLCVSGNTRILTDIGYKAIDSLKDQDVTVWNGFEWSNTKVMQTGENQEMIRVTFSNGASLECTPYHKFYLNTGYYSGSDLDAFKNTEKTKCVEAKDLKVGSKLIKHNFPVIETNNDKFVEPYTHGFFCGDGTYINKFESTTNRCQFIADENGFCQRHQHHNDTGLPENRFDDGICEAGVGLGSPVIYLYGEKKAVKSYLECYNSYENTNHTVLQLNPNIAAKFTVPINCSTKTKIQWLAGLSDADGTIARNGSNESLQISSINNTFLNDIRLMLSTLGVHSKVTLNRGDRKTLMPDGKGGKKLYDCQPIYRLLVTSFYLHKLVDLGFEPKRLKISNDLPNREASHFITVDKIEYLSEPQNTYCFKETKLGLGTFEGIVTGQCAEIVEFSSNEEQAVCNLASMILPKFVEKDEKTGKWFFNHEKLYDATKIVTRNLNKVIDVNFYPTPETKLSNLKHRPIGIGVQGLADAFLQLQYPFESAEAAQLNFEIAETMYFAALDASCELAEISGTYSSYEGSPVSKGILQFDMWNTPTKLTDRWNWTGLRLRIKEYGIRNSLLIALMPTASTSQLMGSYECFEPYSQNNGTLGILNGTYKMVNTYMIRDLIERGLWTKSIQAKVKAAPHGSIQNIREIPKSVRDLYKVVWEIPQKTIIDLAADRGRFVCQSQSMNIYYETPDFGTVATMLMYGWQQGLKTGVYYLRSQPSEQAIKTAVDPNLIKQQDENIEVPASHTVTTHTVTTNTEEPANSTAHHYSSSPPDTNDSINGSGIETSSEFGGENDSTLDNDALQKELDGLDVVETGPVCNNEPGCLSCQ